MSGNHYQKVVNFHRIYNQPVRATSNQVIPREEVELRMKLIAEEFTELADAAGFGASIAVWDKLSDKSLISKYNTKVKPNIKPSYNAVEVADGLADLLYVTYGAAASFGIPISLVFDEVHASNLSKLDKNGHPIVRDDGKILKSENFFVPRIAELLEDWDKQQGYTVHPSKPIYQEELHNEEKV